MSQIELGYSVEQHIDDLSIVNKVLFRWLQIEANGSINITYISDAPPLEVSIDDFLLTLNDYPENPRNGIMAADDSPLDVSCKENCWMVFYLDGKWNWQFSRKNGLNSGFSTKQECSGKYGNLTHVMKGGERIKGPLNKDGCRLLYVKAKCSNVDFKDGFNLHVDLVLPGNKSTTLIIDPVVRNP
jgi:hypothetical protein